MLLKAALPSSAAGKPLEIWFQDEARVGQKGNYDAIVEACVTAWRFLINDPDRIRSVGTRQWARISI